MDIRPITPNDRKGLDALLQKVETFSREERAVALELIDLASKPSEGAPQDYYVLVAHAEDQVVGYICYGPTPMTEGTWDLYWIASDPDVRGQGIGAALCSSMEGDLRERKAARIRVETSATEDYGPARGFYQGMKYLEEARFKDFYKIGDDLIILKKKL